jgi:protein TonB
MWQFAMNSPGNAPRRSGFGAGFSGGNGPELRRINRLLALGCFLIIAALHAALIFAFDFFTKGERPFTEPGELLLTLEFPAPVPAEPALEALPLPAALPLPREEAPPPEPALESVPVPEETALDNVSPAEPERAIPIAASFSGSTEGAVPAGIGIAQGEASAGPRGFSAPAFRPDLRAAAMNRYASMVHGLIDRSKAYPYQARRQEQEGTVRIRFTLSRQGYLAGDPVIEKQSRYRLLNESALEAVKNAAPYPRFPEEIPEDEMSFQVAVSFSFK